MRIIDISKDAANCSVYPGDSETEIEILKRIGGETVYNLSRLTMSPHTGTHADAPLHFIENGADASQIPLSACIGPCRVVEHRAGVITGEEAETLLPGGCERLLIKGNGGSAFFMDSSAEILADSGLKLIGTSSDSVGCKGNELKPHKAFLRAGVCILENLDLSEVKPGEYFLFAAPVKLSTCEAAPVRAVLIDDYIFWSKTK